MRLFLWGKFKNGLHFGESDGSSEGMPMAEPLIAHTKNILSLSWNNGNVIDTIYSTPNPFDNIQSLAFFDGKLFFENPNEPNLITIIDAQTGEELRELRLKVNSDFKIQSLSMLEEGILVSALDSETELNHHFLHSWVNGAVLDTLAISETNYFSLSRHPSSDKYYAVNRGVIEEQPIHSSGEINTLNISESYYFTQVSYSPKDQSLVTYGFNKRNPSNAQFFKIDINSLNVVDSLWLGTSIKNSIIYGPFGLTAKVTDFPFIELISDVESVIPKSESDIVEYRVDGTNLFTNSYYAEITVNSNDPVNSVSTIGIDVHVNGLPGISLPTETVEFKETIVNSTSYERIKIHNSGSDELIISNFEFENNLLQLADTLQKYSIYPRHSMILDVFFNPTDSIGLYSDQLNFKSNINGSSTHGISLEALVLNGSMLSFEKKVIELDLIQNDTASFEIPIANIGDLKLELEAYSYNAISPAIQPSAEGKELLIIQDIPSWEAEIANLITGWFPDLSVTSIRSELLKEEELDIYDAVIFTGAQPFAYYSRLDSNSVKLDEYVLKGGTIFYSLADANDVTLFESIRGKYELSEKAFIYDSLQLQMDSTVVSNLTSLMFFENLPTRTDTLLVSDLGNPILLQVSFGEGQVLASGLVLEYYLTGNGYDDDVVNFYQKIINYVATLDISPDWLELPKSNFQLQKNETSSVVGLINAQGLEVGSYGAQLSASTNMPFNNSDPVLAEITLNVKAGTSIDEGLELPLEFSLNQNYPNPFNPSTKINYSIPEEIKVELFVSNILGQRVMTVVNRKSIPGTYNVTFDATNLSSGVYFYTIKAGDYIETKKMLLIK